MILPETDLFITVTPEVQPRLRTGNIRCVQTDVIPQGFCNGNNRCPISSCRKPCAKGGHDEFFGPCKCDNGHIWQA